MQTINFDHISNDIHPRKNIFNTIMNTPMKFSIKLYMTVYYWSIKIIKGHRLYFSNKPLKIDFVSAEPDEMLHDVTFHLCLRCLP